ncbi:hypothetical protein O6H91_11G070100 [Diphasiastrum complanatum]|uniref:Uncharacterized protein n=2 Tax=Diphasiastrum complanatum TaxID=34168 RepID=A0ACC2CA69_DIPCM|nr:hypothetical protein O6H91_11G070100 [Diphasiastrum complanatum]KAJ7538949.1 hypothetical protein O6H91_11G070100 [Diphasiastrum complanatum]
MSQQFAVKLTSTDDYHAWLVEIHHHLRSQGYLWEIVNGEIAEPEDHASQEYLTWKEANGKALSVIGPEHPIAEDKKLIIFLRALPKSYMHVRSILGRTRGSTFEDAVQPIYEEEQMKDDDLIVDDTVPLVKGTTKPQVEGATIYFAGQKKGKSSKDKEPKRCSHCGKDGHSKNTCWYNPNIPSKFCKKDGHAANFCPKKPPRREKEKGKEKETVAVADESLPRLKSHTGELQNSYTKGHDCAYYVEEVDCYPNSFCMQGGIERSKSMHVNKSFVLQEVAQQRELKQESSQESSPTHIAL